MRRLILPVIFFIVVTAVNTWGAERRPLTPPLMPPEFPQSPFGFSKGDQKRGETIYQRNACPSCHLIEGKGAKVGPDLSRVGEKGTLPEWYRQQLVNTHKPPVVLIQQDMDDLIAYLQSLKLLR